MKKTKVVCTMGPNTNDKEVMRKLIQKAGGYIKKILGSRCVD